MIPAAQAAEQPLVIGIQPFASPTTLFERYAPLRDRIGDRLGRPARVETARDFPTFLARAHRERYDLILMVAPHQIPILGNGGPYDLLVRSRDHLAMAIIVPADSPVRHPRDLAAHRVAAGHRDSFGAVLARQILAPADGPEQTPDYRYYPHQSGAIAAMQRGLAQAAVVVLDASALANDGAAKRARTLALSDGSLARIIVYSDAFPGATLLLHPRLKTHRDALGQHLRGLSTHPEGAALLRRINHTGFETSDPADYAQFEAFDINPWNPADPVRPLPFPEVPPRPH
ncbi:MAG: PhnD/SsuA/transferrin family substrate-binding protein [Pseudomonadota bacterium]